MSTPEKNPSMMETDMTPKSRDKFDESFGRAQPWKQFVKVTEGEPVAFVGNNKNIRMKEGRVDGKDIGG